MSNSGRGLLFIVSAPSGAGKTTLVERLVEQVPHLRMSRSYTSRAARRGELDGVDYNFVTRSRFESMVAGERFLEWADVFGNLYGTSADDTERTLEAGDDLVLVIDVQGARQVRSRGLETTAIFVMPPSFEVLERRLRGRSKDSGEAIERRLQVARRRGVQLSRVRVHRRERRDRGRRRSSPQHCPLDPFRVEADDPTSRTHSQDIFMIDRSKLTNTFEFVVTAGARARQLMAGSTPRVAVGDHKKTTIATQEVITRAVEKIEDVAKE